MRARPAAIGQARSHSENDSKARIVAGRMTTGSPLLVLCGTYRHMASSDNPHLIFTNGTGKAETPHRILWCEPRVIQERLQRCCTARFAMKLLLLFFPT